ncbi:hypothetical protein Cal6303_5489 [Calothrix sp. PCC 6303]|nr:hypothetical protein Cal6303_5489 [Calothrix sp. PCC 6303]
MLRLYLIILSFQTLKRFGGLIPQQSTTAARFVCESVLQTLTEGQPPLSLR